MPIVRITKDTNIAALRAASAKTAPGMLERLNPHLDLHRLEPGAVLVLPDSGETGGKDGKPSTRGAATSTVSAEAMQSFVGFTKEALEVCALRMRGAAERAKAEESALAAASKSRFVNLALERDPELKQQLAAALRQASADTQAAAEGAKAFSTLAAAALAEIEGLTRRLG